MNSLILIIIGSLLESIVGFKKTALIWLVSVLGGTIMEALEYKNVEVQILGWSPVSFIMPLIAYLIVNWKAMESNSNLRCCFLMMIIFVTIFMLLNSLGSSASGMGMLGSILTSFTLGMWVVPRINPLANRAERSTERIAKLFGMLGLAIYFVTCYLVFFLGSKIAKTPFQSTCPGVGRF
jgi:membrane associated rhomboid family serine protease